MIAKPINEKEMHFSGLNGTFDLSHRCFHTFKVGSIESTRPSGNLSALISWALHVLGSWRESAL